MEENKAPSGEKLLALLIDLYADQCGLEIKYKIVGKEEKT